MATRSRVLQYLAVAALPIIALLSGCATGGQKAFRYLGPLQGKAAPEVIEINSDCKVSPEWAVVNLKLLNWWNPRRQVLWHLTDRQKGDSVVISGGPAELRDAKHQLLRQIPGLFQSKYEIPEADVVADAIRSGVPKHVLGLLHRNESIVWKYQVDYFRDRKLLCTKDPPDICVQKWGSTGCNTP